MALAAGGDDWTVHRATAENVNVPDSLGGVDHDRRYAPWSSPPAENAPEALEGQNARDWGVVHPNTPGVQGTTRRTATGVVADQCRTRVPGAAFAAGIVAEAVEADGVN